MKKIRKIFRGAWLLIRKPSLINNILNDNENFKNYVCKNYNLAEGLNVISIENFIPNEGIIISPFASLDGGSNISDLALIKSICLKNMAQDYLEIGTWRGESVAVVSEIVQNCYTVNISNDEIIKAGYSEDYAKMHCFFSHKLQNVNHIRANSLNFNFNSLNKKFDVIFIDGDHHYENIVKDTKTAFSLLKNENSVIIWHDYAYSPETPRFEVLAGILDGSPADKISGIYHVSNTICAIYSNKNFDKIIPSKNKTPLHYFNISLSVSKL